MTTPYDCTRHRCDYCRRSYASKSAARKHEAACWRNPVNQACPTCAHFTNSESWISRCDLGLSRSTSGDPDDESVQWEHHCPSWKERT